MLDVDSNYFVIKSLVDALLIIVYPSSIFLRLRLQSIKLKHTSMKTNTSSQPKRDIHKQLDIYQA